MTIPPRTPNKPDTLTILVERRLQTLPRDDDLDGVATMVTIFRIPAHVREANKQLYEPRMVSIGPYYRDREELCAMEQHKLRYLSDFLGRSGRIGETPPPLSSYVEAVQEVEERARRSYYERTKLSNIKSEANNIMSSDSRQNNAEPSEDAHDGFAEMLLLDGCFILEFLFKWLEGGADSLHNVGWGLALLNSDLLLLENQIPFFVLVSLYTVLCSGRMVPQTAKDQLIYDLVNLLQNTTFSRDRHPVPDTVFTVEIHHLLHLYHEAFVPKPNPEPRNIQPDDNSLSEQAVQAPGGPSAEALEEEHINVFEQAEQMPGDPSAEALEEEHINVSEQAEQMPGGPSAEAPEEEHSNGGNSATVIPCTTQLREAGVRFKRKKSPKNMFDITFSRGVMEIPRVELDHMNKPLLVNLIAFEQSMGKKGAAAPLTSYTALMTGLVRTGKDVEVLQKHGIIDNMLSSEDDAAKSYFNHLGDCCTLDYDDHYYAPEFARLNKHYKSSWNKDMAKFRRDHCANPCSIVSFVVTVMVFSFAVSQASINFYRLHGHH